ncbi:MAG: phosphate signaling complex protein PhoU [Planctomycetaceae bacterium]|nr:phosphate signaling complex protein PhoU [Planctomycetota bacterium]NUN51316.1 phosphate signaling complex protein PhoU [Planctomycetaceae bacterium]
MPKHFHEEMEDLTKKVLHMGGLVEAALDRALEALLDRDSEAARAVIEGDNVIDELELDIEEKCLDLLALHQPVARDLRYIAGILKINSDLERMADLAANIAERSEVLSQVPPLPFRPDVSRMAAVVKQMVREGLDALVKRDVAAALRVWKRDDEADRLFREILGEAIQFMRAQPDRIGDTQHLTGALRNLERIADHATNIAEDVIFMAEGRIVRHHVMEFHRVIAAEGGAGG